MPTLLFLFHRCRAGLVYLRVPTWAPFRLQFYCNGHSWLARQLTAEGIGFTAADNAFVRIDDWQRAQDLADRFSPDRLHLVLDRYAAQCCPVLDVFGQSYHWSLMQVEYATDLVFRSVATLRPLYEHLARKSVLSVKAEQIASFLGRQITPQLAQEIGSQLLHSHRGDLHQAPLRQVPRSRCTTSSAACSALRRQSTTSPSSSTTARWNTAGAADAGPRPRQEDHLQPD